MAMRTLALPVAPEKLDEWRAFARELDGPKRPEWEEALKRHGGLKERAFLQESGPNGPMVVYTMKGRKHMIQDIFSEIGASSDPFEHWFAQRMKELHGVDLTSLKDQPDPTLIYKVKPPVAH
jgi:hypothetical protein